MAFRENHDVFPTTNVINKKPEVLYHPRHK